MDRVCLALGTVVVALLAVACGSSEPGTTQEPGSTAASASPVTQPPAELEAPPVVPTVDLSLHIVPLDDMHFDTFDGGSVPLSESDESLRVRLRDAIPPIDEPAYGGVEEGRWLADDDLILGYDVDQGAYAYPIKILNFHEIVNDVIDGIPVLISYCPLCRSGIVFDRRLDGQTLSFGNTSALYESDLVMLDRQTGSYWWQVAGKAIVGTLTGSQLTPLPSVTTTWGQWKELHPETRVLSRQTGFDRDYLRDPFATYADFVNSGGFPFPVSEAVRDRRLAPAEIIVGVDIGAASRAYPPRLIGQAAVNDNLSGVPVVVFTSTAEPTGAVFSPLVDGRVLTFAFVDGGYVDTQTNSTWDISGRAVAGELAPTQLVALPSRTTFWFAYVGAFPDADVHAPESGQGSTS